MIYHHNGKQYAVTAERLPCCEVICIDKYFETLTTNVAQIDLYEIQSPYDKIISDKIEDFNTFVLKEIDGKPYEAYGSEFLLSKYHANKSDDYSSFFCSELVVYIAKRYGFPLEGLSDNYTPDDLAKRSDIWKKIDL